VSAGQLFKWCPGFWWPASERPHPCSDSPRPARPSGIEVVRAELVAGRTRWVSDAEALADGELQQAQQLYSVHSTGSVFGVAPCSMTPWSECCTDTVRRWVAVAREARRMHGGGR
jgi:hypothetical protein